MISVNKVIGTFTIFEEQAIELPICEKVVFTVDSSKALISINDNQHYMEYRNIDDIIEFHNDVNNYVGVSKLYVKSIFPVGDPNHLNNPAILRVWVMI